MADDAYLVSMSATLGAQPAKPADGSTAKKPDTTKDWEILLTSMKNYDKTLIDGWIASMNNLLIFAGLFSAVVTAFVIETYSQLQQDPTDTTNALLTQMSQQLASFSVNSGFVNSTAPAAAVPAPFQPDVLYVRVNVLWFLSLALSLIAALFAILVQQWLSEYPVRRVTSVREGVHLRQLRFDALYNWGVPDIVALLPVLLQIALLLFLSGLILLLWSLNSIVAHAVTVILAVPMAFFVSTALLPLISASCPYKSTITTILLTFSLIILMFIVYIAVAWFVISYLAFALLLLAAESLGFTRIHSFIIAQKIANLSAPLFRINSTFLKRLASRGEWVNGDFHTVQKEKARLSYAALCWSPHALSNSAAPQFDRCLLNLDAGHRAACALKWTAIAFNMSANVRAAHSRTIEYQLLRHRETERLAPSNAERLRTMLLDSWDGDETDVRTSKAILVFLRYLVKLGGPDAGYMLRYNRMLLDLAMGTKVPAGRSPAKKATRLADRVRVVTRSLFDSWATYDIPVDIIDIPQFQTWLNLTLSSLLSDANGANGTRHRFYEHDSALSVIAAGFLLHEKSHAADFLPDLYAWLRRFVQLQRWVIVDSARMANDTEPRTDMFSPQLWLTLAETMHALAMRPPPQRLPSRMVLPVVLMLFDIFERARGEYFENVACELREIQRCYRIPLEAMDTLTYPTPSGSLVAGPTSAPDSLNGEGAAGTVAGPEKDPERANPGSSGWDPVGMRMPADWVRVQELEYEDRMATNEHRTQPAVQGEETRGAPELPYNASEGPEVDDPHSS